MKKLISMLLSILLVVSLLPSAVFATEATNAQFAFSVDPAETTQFKVGDTFKVNLALANNPGFGAMTLKLTWNAEAVAFEGFDMTTNEDDEEVLDSEVLSTYDPTVNHEIGAVVSTRAKGIKKSGKIFTANFKVVGEGAFNIGLKDGNDFEYIDTDRVTISYTMDTAALSGLTCDSSEPEPEGNPIASVTVSHPNIVTTTDPETGAISKVMNIVAGVSEKLKVDITAENPNADATQVINWKSTNSNVAEVIDDVLKAYKEGTVTLNAFAADVSAAAVMAAEEPVPLATLTVNVTDAAEDKFTVSLGNDLNVTPADTISVPVTVDHETENSTYNAYELVFTYNPEYLTLKTTNDNTDGKEFTVVDDNGTVTIRRYGDPLNAGEKAFDLEFTAEQTGTSNVKLTSANVGTSQDAQNINVPEAQIQDNLTIVTVIGYNVQLPEDDFNGESVAAPDKDYTFEAKNKFYDYTFTVTIDGQPVDNAVVDNGNGTYTIAKGLITGSVEITVASKTGKTFDVIVEGNGKDQLKPEGELKIGEDAAQYANSYQFTVESKGEGYSYAVSVKIGGGEAEVYTPVDGVYTIEGTNITGDITITVTETEPTVEDHTVTITGNGAADIVDGTAAETVAHNGNYTFDLKMVDGYDYKITAIMSQQKADVEKAEEANDDGSYTYTIKGITADLTITIEKSNLKVEVDEYVTLKDNSSLFLVTATMDLEEDQALAYNSKLMYLKEFKVDEDGNKQWYYSYLVAVDEGQTLTPEAAAELITVTTVTADTKAAQTLAVDYDVNGSHKLDINDAQLVYNMYKAVYGSDDLETVSVMKFLKGDLNGDRTINVSDAAAVVNEILNPTTGE